MRRLTLFALSLVFVLTLLPGGANSAAAATTTGVVRGGGAKDTFGFGSNVTIQSDGTAKGFFFITDQTDTTPMIVCLYYSFSNASISGSVATFDMAGVCYSPTGTFAASNHTTIIDNGHPGAGVDAIDVNFLGSGGIAIPGGVIQTGDLIVRATPA
jgi:hypothetical protein